MLDMYLVSRLDIRVFNSWFKKIKQPVLIGLIEYVLLDLTWRESLEVSSPIGGSKIVSNAIVVCKQNGTLGEFDVVFPFEDCSGGRTDHVEISKVQGKLDVNILEALRAALVHSAILHRQED